MSNPKCARCGSSVVPGENHAAPEGCIKALRRDLEAVYQVVEHLTATTGNVVARIELCHTAGQQDFTLYLTTGAQTRDDVLGALLAAQLKSAYIFGKLVGKKT